MKILFICLMIPHSHTTHTEVKQSVGPHAMAVKNTRAEALLSFGIRPENIAAYQNNIAKQARADREQRLSNEV